jgi:hypothetical protein
MYEGLAAHRMALLQTTMDAVIAAEVNVLFPILKALFLIYIGQQFLLAMAGDLTMQRFWSTVMRSGIIILLVTHNGAFVQYVRDPIFTQVPQALAAMVAGGADSTANANAPLAVQFDHMAGKVTIILLHIMHQMAIDDPVSWLNALFATWSFVGFQLLLALIVAVWLIGQTFIAIILAIGLPMLCFELFDRTRGFVDAWIGKILGLLAFGFGTSFLLALSMKDLTDLMTAVLSTDDTTLQATLFFQVVEGAALDLLAMVGLPAIVAFGSGAAASMAAPSAFMAMRALTMTTTAPVMAAARGAMRVAKAGAGAARNSMRGGA